MSSTGRCPWVSLSVGVVVVVLLMMGRPRGLSKWPLGQPSWWYSRVTCQQGKMHTSLAPFRCRGDVCSATVDMTSGVPTRMLTCNTWDGVTVSTCE